MKTLGHFNYADLELRIVVQALAAQGIEKPTAEDIERYVAGYLHEDPRVSSASPSVTGRLPI